jgi:hypothetical protein
VIAAVTLLFAFASGWFLRSRLAANTAYSIAYLWAFTFQTLYLMLDSLGGGSNPAFETGDFPWSYGVVALAIFAGGFGLVSLGHYTRARRTAKRAGTAEVRVSAAVTE